MQLHKNHYVCPYDFSLFLQSIGADEVVNYREQDFAEVYKDPSKHFDLIVDLIGGESSELQVHCQQPLLTRWICLLDCLCLQENVASGK